MRRRPRGFLLLLTTMLAALVMASGVALAVDQVCPSDTIESGPCTGTEEADTLTGTSGDDYIVALSGNDHISAEAGDDVTDGGAGNDVYSYADGWGADTVYDASGFDTLDFSAVSGGISAELNPESVTMPQNRVRGPAGESVGVYYDYIAAHGHSVEKVVGSASGFDDIITGGAHNILQPGPGKGGAKLTDWGGAPNHTPLSDDTYSGLLPRGFGPVVITDWGGAKDKLILPFASTRAYFVAYNSEGVCGPDTLLIMRTTTDYVLIYGQLEPRWCATQAGHLETIKFTNGKFSIGKGWYGTGDRRAAQVDKLNAASKLSRSEKAELAEAAKKILSS